ncbi:MAG: 4Fe-4S dicluster domain-containing protein [Bacteriovoracaceae bacterium]|nr:4Fe-4S dicluster domain-containing protein [Bacteriovoracaceae bacterium]
MQEKVARVEVDKEQCKGCALCVNDCPPNVLFMSKEINHMGYSFAVYADKGCTGCGICFYSCPEAGTITVYKK